jgi:hypothetical protein
MGIWEVIVTGLVVIICKIIDAIAKNKRIDKLEKLDNSKIQSIGKYEGKSKSNPSLFNFWRNKIDKT